MERRAGLTNKLARLGNRLHDRQWRRYGYLLLAAGKILGLVLLLGLIGFATSIIGAEVMAADPKADPIVSANAIINPINTLWVLLAAFLVLGMQVGFTMLEAGFCRSRETRQCPDGMRC